MNPLERARKAAEYAYDLLSYAESHVALTGPFTRRQLHSGARRFNELADAFEKERKMDRLATLKNLAEKPKPIEAYRDRSVPEKITDDMRLALNHRETIAHDDEAALCTKKGWVGYMRWVVDWRSKRT